MSVLEESPPPQALSESATASAAVVRKRCALGLCFLAFNAGLRGRQGAGWVRHNRLRLGRSRGWRLFRSPMEEIE